MAAAVARLRGGGARPSPVPRLGWWQRLHVSLVTGGGLVQPGSGGDTPLPSVARGQAVAFMLPMSESITEDAATATAPGPRPGVQHNVRICECPGPGPGAVMAVFGGRPEEW